MTSKRRAQASVLLLIAMISWSCASSTEVDSTEADVVGARHVSREYLPATATIYAGPDRQGRLLATCGGALIAPGWVLTSARCCIARRPAIVVLGRSDLAHAEEGREVLVRDVVIHPDHFASSDGSTKNDIALLALAQNTGSASALLAEDEPASGTQLDAVGWGYPGSDGSPTTLLGFPTETISREACAQELSLPIGSNMLCTKRRTTVPLGLAARSGSALWDRRGGKDVIAGVYAFTTSDPDAPQRPQVYMSVASYARWIVEVTRQP